MYPFVSLAWGATGTPLDAVMQNAITLVIMLAGGVVIGVIAWKGVRHALERNFDHVGAEVGCLGLGCGMIGGARPLGTYIMGFGGAWTVDALHPLMLNDLIGTAIAMLLSPQMLILLVALYLVRRRINGRDRDLRLV